MAERRSLRQNIERRNKALAEAFAATSPRSTTAAGRGARKVGRRIAKKSVNDITNKSPEQIARALNRQRIKSQSREVSRKRGKTAQLKGLKKRSKRGSGFKFIEGKSRF